MELASGSKDGASRMNQDHHDLIGSLQGARAVAAAALTGSGKPERIDG
jgi:hypothetical protein